MAEDLDDYNERFDQLIHLRHFMNKIEFRFDDHSSSSELDTVEVSAGESGSIEMNISGFQPIPLSKLTSGKLTIGNQTIWTFDAASQEIQKLIDVTDDSHLSLQLAGDHIGGLVVRGVVDGLRQEEHQRLKGGRDHFVRDVMRILVESEGTFTPQTFIYQDKTLLKKTLGFIIDIVKDFHSYEHQCSCCVDLNDFHKSVIAALGSKNDMLKLRSLIELKNKARYLQNLADHVDRVTLVDSDNAFSVDLSRGLRANVTVREESYTAWIMQIQKHLRGNFLLVISEIALQRKPRFFFHTFIDEDEDVVKAKVHIEFFPGAVVEGIVPLDDEILDNFDDFEEDFRTAFRNGELEVYVTFLIIKMTAIEDTLEVLGIDHRREDYCCPCCNKDGCDNESCGDDE
jgi:hypothetical protein